MSHRSLISTLLSEGDKETSDGPKRCSQFLKTFSEEVSIHFVGLWDIVNSTGALWPRVLPGTAGEAHVSWDVDMTDHLASIGNPDCRFFRHALALDERRVRFKPTIGRSYPEHLYGDIPRVKQIWLAGNHCGARLFLIDDVLSWLTMPPQMLEAETAQTRRV
jgi:uncharacterized protein (DUF2235 family)